MKKVQSILQVTRNLFFCEWNDKRVIMGFLAGMAVPFFWLKNFLDYAAGTGEPVNILEAFLVVEHEYKTVMFLALGWFLVISDAPFISGNTLYSDTGCVLYGGGGAPDGTGIPFPWFCGKDVEQSSLYAVAGLQYEPER